MSKNVYFLYSSLENNMPKITARVFLPVLTSISASLRLFTTKIAVAKEPIATPQRKDSVVTYPV